MKKVILPAICILLCTLCILFVPTEAEAQIYEDTVRLHILAPSDTVADQNLKLELRDFILNKYGKIISDSSSTAEAESKLLRFLPLIEEDCRAFIVDAGYSYPVTVELTEEWFNTRDYSVFSLPSGRYVSLTVTIGGGKGQNWWCVMYPPLCLDAALSDTADTYSDDELRLISKGGYRIKFKLLEVASAIFNEENKKFPKSS